MKKFEFKLQRLLEIRLDKEEQQKIVLAKVSGEYQREVNRKNEILENIQNVNARLKMSNPPSLSELRAYDLLMQDSDSAISQIEIVMEKKRKVMERELQIYVKLKQDRRAVEILREKAWDKYQKEEADREMKEYDEIGKNIFLKNKANEKNSEN